MTCIRATRKSLVSLGPFCSPMEQFTTDCAWPPIQVTTNYARVNHYISLGSRAEQSVWSEGSIGHQLSMLEYHHQFIERSGANDGGKQTYSAVSPGDSYLILWRSLMLVSLAVVVNHHCQYHDKQSV